MPCTPEFIEIVAPDWRVQAVCPFCGRINYATGDVDLYADDELELLEYQRQADPGKYCSHPEKELRVGILEGRQVVVGCVCQRLESIENWIWHNRMMIIHYFSSRAANRFKNSQIIMGECANIESLLLQRRGGK